VDYWGTDVTGFGLRLPPAERGILPLRGELRHYDQQPASQERHERHGVVDVVFLVDDSYPLKDACRRHSLDFRYENIGIGITSNVPFEKKTNHQFLELFQQRQSRHRRQLASILRMESASSNTTLKPIPNFISAKYNECIDIVLLILNGEIYVRAQ